MRDVGTRASPEQVQDGNDDGPHNEPDTCRGEGVGEPREEPTDPGNGRSGVSTSLFTSSAHFWIFPCTATQVKASDVRGSPSPTTAVEL